MPVEERTICAVDLGLNQNAVCSIMRSNGTVVARKFINFPTEKDHLYKALGRQKKAQQHGNRKTPVLWKHVNDINTEISRKIAKAIMEFALLHQADVIVFEHLDIFLLNLVLKLLLYQIVQEYFLLIILYFLPIQVLIITL